MLAKAKWSAVLYVERRIKGCQPAFPPIAFWPNEVRKVTHPPHQPPGFAVLDHKKSRVRRWQFGMTLWRCAGFNLTLSSIFMAGTLKGKRGPFPPNEKTAFLKVLKMACISTDSKNHCCLTRCFWTANIWPSMCCAGNHPARQESENRSCHINERFFIESQMIESVAFA